MLTMITSNKTTANSGFQLKITKSYCSLSILYYLSALISFSSVAYSANTFNSVYFEDTNTAESHYDHKNLNNFANKQLMSLGDAASDDSLLTDSNVEVIRINKGKSSSDVRSKYNLEILRRALEHSLEKFGPYRLEVIEQSIPNFRKWQLFRENKIINVAMAMTSQEWEQEAIPIRIPIRRGILNYRLLMINKKHLSKFENITTQAQLKELTAGLRRSWALWQTMSYLEFPIVNAFSYDAIFKMLAKERFDYIPRGIHEIYDEISFRRAELPDLAVAPNIALYIPAAFYIFVAPNHPEIARRLEYGLEKMVSNKEIERLFKQYYGAAITQAKMNKRHIIDIGNPFIPTETPFERKELWIQFEGVAGSN